MQRTRLYLVCLFTALSSGCGEPRYLFNTPYSGAYDTGGNLFVTGLAPGYAEPTQGIDVSSDIWIARYNTSQETVWSQAVSSEAFDETGLTVALKPGGGLSVLADSDGHPLLLDVSTDGTRIEGLLLQGANVYDARMTYKSDGSMVLAGAGSGRGWFAGLDAQGGLQWYREVVEPTGIIPAAVVDRPGRDVLLVWNHDLHVLLMSLDEQGQVSSQQLLGDADRKQTVSDAILLQSGEIMLLGDHRLPSYTDPVVWLGKLDSADQIVWQREIRTYMPLYVQKLMELPSGELIITAIGHSTLEEYTTFFVVLRLDADGNQLDQVVVEEPGSDGTLTMHERSSDGGIEVASQLIRYQGKYCSSLYFRTFFSEDSGPECESWGPGGDNQSFDGSATMQPADVVVEDGEVTVRATEISSCNIRTERRCGCL